MKYRFLPVLLLVAALLFTGCGQLRRAPEPASAEAETETGFVQTETAATLSQTAAWTTQSAVSQSTTTRPAATRSTTTTRPTTTRPATTRPTTTRPVTTAPATTVPATTAPATAAQVTTVPETTAAVPPTTAPTTAAATTAPPVTTAADALRPEEAAALLTLINAYRAQHGAGPLTEDPTLAQLAAVRAQEQMTRFSHTRPDGRSWKTVFDDAGVPRESGRRAEDLALVPSGTAPEAILDAWKGSPAHNASILDPAYTRIGVALYADPARNQTSAVLLLST